MSDLPDLGPGDLIYVDGVTSVQFVAYPIVARVIRPLTELRPTYWQGWQWFRVYQLGRGGWAIAERDIYIQPGMVLRLSPAAAAAITSGGGTPTWPRPGPPRRRAVNERPGRPGRSTPASRRR